MPVGIGRSGHTWPDCCTVTRWRWRSAQAPPESAITISLSHWLNKHLGFRRVDRHVHSSSPAFEASVKRPSSQSPDEPLPTFDSRWCASKPPGEGRFSKTSRFSSTRSSPRCRPGVTPLGVLLRISPSSNWVCRWRAPESRSPAADASLLPAVSRVASSGRWHQSPRLLPMPALLWWW